MNAALQNANGPAGGCTPCQAGSTIPGKEKEMNEANDITGAAKAPVLSRRGFLGGVAITAIPLGAKAASSEPATVSIDEFLAKALPSEKASYHSNALLDAMAELHPDQVGWRAQIDHEHAFAIVTARRKVGKVYAVVDDGSPLFADDVTGTTAFADWEASR